MKAGEFADEYRSMRAQGMSHDEIARAFGVQRESLLRRMLRNGVAYLPESDERSVYAALEGLIASGREFTSGELGTGGTSQTRMAALLRARNSGRIEVTCRTRDTGHRYRAVASNGSVAA